MTQNFEPRPTQVESRLDRVEIVFETLAVSLTAEREQRQQDFAETWVLPNDKEGNRQ
jgi:hypothetical protein